MSEPCLHSIGQPKIYDKIPCAYPILDPKILSKFERWKEEVPNVSPIFQNKLYYFTSSWYNFYSKKDQAHVFVSCRQTLRITKGHFTHKPRAVIMKLWEPRRKCPRVVPRDLQNNVVWSRALKCSVKSYVTGPSTKCYFNVFLFMRVLTQW